MPRRKLNRYKLTLSLSGSVNVFIDAKSAEDAENMVLDGNYSCNKADIEIDDVSVIDIEQLRSSERVSSSD